jgi:gluconokinase
VILLGVDIGTSAVKAVAFEVPAGRAPRVLALESRPLLLDVPAAGLAEQDPKAVLAATRSAMDACLSQARPQAIAMTGAMHSLLALDASGQPLTQAITWADQRAAAQAAALPKRPTGTPRHAMAPSAKIAWLQASRPDIFTRAATFCGLKEYVQHALGAALVMDRSMASGTGLYDVVEGTWDALLESHLAIAGRLPPLVETTSVIGAVDGIPLVAGCGDGPAASLGAGAMTALTLGTSAALRVITRGPHLDPTERNFCYHVLDNVWVSGGAISNCGLVFNWLLKMTGGDPVTEAAVSSEGLTFLPYLAGARAPHWNPSARGTIFGMTLHHTRAHVARAAQEGVAFSLRDVLDALPLELSGTMRASGGLSHDAGLLQVMADALRHDIETVAIEEGTALGAALLASRAVDPSSDPLFIAARQSVVQRVSPTASLEKPLTRFRSLYEAVSPLF